MPAPSPRVEARWLAEFWERAEFWESFEVGPSVVLVTTHQSLESASVRLECSAFPRVQVPDQSIATMVKLPMELPLESGCCRGWATALALDPIPIEPFVLYTGGYERFLDRCPPLRYRLRPS